ncbi:hypothetical protein EDB84DRAFT_1459112 [Lactarius hengduanensis]|nr:hypothetical protein EDB84DRAFT_1459112 [Lactarius hengduanensis]
MPAKLSFLPLFAMSSPASFTFGERLGLILLAETSAVSACAVVGLLSYIAYSAVSVTRGSSIRWRLGSPAEVYFLNQLSWDLVQAVGGLMNIKWAIDASVQPGSFCSAQGAIKHLSDVGAALSTLIISLYTLRTLCFSKIILQPDEEEKEQKKTLHRSFVVVACLWSAVGLLVAVNIAANGVYRFYGPAGYWCWIRRAYSVQRTVADFGFMWATAIFNVVIYAVVFLYFQGYITTSGWKIRVSRKPNTDNVLGPLRQACGLLFYPLVYIFNVLPLSAVRYSSFAHHDVPFGIIVFTDIIYLSSGLLNVLLFSITRPFLLPHDLPKPDSVSDIMTSHSIKVANSPRKDSAQGHELYQWPRSESPASHIQSDSTAEASTEESEVPWYGAEKVEARKKTSHSLDYYSN